MKNTASAENIVYVEFVLFCFFLLEFPSLSWTWRSVSKSQIVVVFYVYFLRYFLFVLHGPIIRCRWGASDIVWVHFFSPPYHVCSFYHMAQLPIGSLRISKFEYPATKLFENAQPYHKIHLGVFWMIIRHLDLCDKWRKLLTSWGRATTNWISGCFPVSLVANKKICCLLTWQTLLPQSW